jgi:hypothetical protein
MEGVTSIEARRRTRGAWWLLAFVVLAGGPIRAETTTERSASIVIFPKVIFDEDIDTLIQISNTTNSMVHAHCFYVNAVGFCERREIEACLTNADCGPTGPCVPQWQEVDFDIWLTKQQPTHWAAGIGRFDNLLDPQCDRNVGNYECDGAGFDPGRVPPVGFPFYGELKCFEVDQSGAPISGNHLKGEATIVTVDGDASKYNAVGILGEPLTNDGNTTLCLGGDVSESCPSGAEYQACADVLILNHFAERADNPLIGPTSQVRTELTLVPCAQDLELQRPSRVVVQFEVYNEFENVFSGSTTVDCWKNFLLSDATTIFNVTTLGSRVVQTRLRPSNASLSGIVGVSEEFHRVDDLQARVAFNLHEEGERERTDFIVLPSGP